MSETLTEFLMARIAEDEAAARDGGADAMTGHRWKHLPEAAYNEIQSTVLANSRRVLAECEAKRRIVEEYGELRSTVMAYRSPRWQDAMNEQDKQERSKAGARHAVAERFLRILALPYADHQDYRDEWRP